MFSNIALELKNTGFRMLLFVTSKYDFLKYTT